MEVVEVKSGRKTGDREVGEEEKANGVGKRWGAKASDCKVEPARGGRGEWVKVRVE